ncbi:MAG: nucleotidyl transferase AbiEii/AbiGii toxin family protein, partial [Candidatus Aenigmarchaeota archaeon]|nr:nucleotidyl transferase AbiEii/AbiGii toxin family protein [Candidatus Aenigmarchaeota archaeon]
MADIGHFRALSAKHGLPLQFVIKEFHVIALLGKIMENMGNEQIIFKGGTALNRCFAAGISRFSEDLDF